MNTDNGEQSPEFRPSCSGGFCGRIDFDHVFQRIDPKPEVDDETALYILMMEAEELIYRHQHEGGLCLYEKAYALARESEELGPDACFGVMFHLHYFGFHEQSLRMCIEIAEAAARIPDVSLLRDLWRLLPEVGIPGGHLNEQAMELRDEIEGNCPEVMSYEKSRRF
jgi:hypothetical protein